MIIENWVARELTLEQLDELLDSAGTALETGSIKIQTNAPHSPIRSALDERAINIERSQKPCKDGLFLLVCSPCHSRFVCSELSGSVGWRCLA
jgi:hypothetical protein